MDEIIFYSLIACLVCFFLLFFKPFRDLLVGILGAKSLWGGVIGLIRGWFSAHYDVIRNFAPRDVIYPSVANKKSTRID